MVAAQTKDTFKGFPLIATLWEVVADRGQGHAIIGEASFALG